MTRLRAFQPMAGSRLWGHIIVDARGVPNNKKLRTWIDRAVRSRMVDEATLRVIR